MKICAMQPAFAPPASYFRLFAASDFFVILDSVQFNRRWYTHRQKLTTKAGTKDWLTLPIKKTDRDTTRICDLEWAEDYQERWSKELGRFTENEHFPIPENMSPLAFVCSGLLNTCSILGIPIKAILAQSIPIPDDLRGQDRIIAICKFLHATHYINSPGGRELYDKKVFEDNGISLEFLPEWTGSYDSVAERLKNEEPIAIREEIYAQI